MWMISGGGLASSRLRRSSGRPGSLSPKIVEEGAVDLAHLGLRVGAASGIVDDVVGAPGLLGDGHLTPDPGAGVSLARPVARPQSLELNRLVDDDHDDPV